MRRGGKKKRTVRKGKGQQAEQSKNARRHMKRRLSAKGLYPREATPLGSMAMAVTTNPSKP